MSMLSNEPITAAQKASLDTSLGLLNTALEGFRKPVELNLQAGTTDVSETNVTAQVEPDSVVLRDVTGKRPIRILEQNYDGSLRVQAQMLAKFEGKTIDFSIPMSDGSVKLVPGSISLVVPATGPRGRPATRYRPLRRRPEGGFVLPPRGR